MTLNLRRNSTTAHGGGIYTAHYGKLMIGSVLEEIDVGRTSWRWSLTCSPYAKKRGRKPTQQARPARSGRLSFGQMDRVLREGPPAARKGPGGWRLPNHQIGRLLFDKAFEAALADRHFTVPAHVENGVLHGRGMINEALCDAWTEHTMDAMCATADDHARLFVGELGALVEPLTRLRSLPVEHLKASLSLQGAPGRKIDFDAVMDAAAYLIGSARLLPQPALLRRRKEAAKVGFRSNPRFRGGPALAR